MATRTFCDHCGNTVRNPQRFEFGPQRIYNSEEQSIKAALAQMKQYGVGGGVAGAQQMPAVQQAPPPTKQPTKVVDLCDTCAPIWYERVDKLCRGSDPKEENNGG